MYYEDNALVKNRKPCVADRYLKAILKPNLDNGTFHYRHCKNHKYSSECNLAEKLVLETEGKNFEEHSNEIL